MRHAVVAALLVAATGACSIPEKQYNSPYSCYKKDLPSKANDPVTISATLLDPYQQKPVDHASIDVYQISPFAKLFTVMSDGAGHFEQPQGTFGVPRAIFFRATKEKFVDTYFYPAVPITSDYFTQIVMFTPEELDTIAGNLGTSVDPAMSRLSVTVLDCNGDPVAGATIATTPFVQPFYLNSSFTPSKDAGGTSTDMTTGTGLIANISASNIIINATVSGMDLRTHSVTGVMGALVETDIQP